MNLNIKSSPEVDKIILWFEGQTYDIDFDLVVNNFEKLDFRPRITIASEEENVLTYITNSINASANSRIECDQFTLFRKLFSIIHRNKSEQVISYFEKLKRLTLLSNIDIEIKICIVVLEELINRNSYLEENILTEKICKFFNEGISALNFDNLFEKCTGLITLNYVNEPLHYWKVIIEGKKYSLINDQVLINDKTYSINKIDRTIEIEGQIYQYKWYKGETDFIKNQGKIPKGITFCDAVKSGNEDVRGIYFWCCNRRCYSTCQSDHTYLEWSQYTLRDFVKILGLEFDQDKFYRFVTILNRINRLLQKLYCTECKHILRDSRTSQFAFYRVTTFHCTNPNCSEFKKVIYLNHCFNWKCRNVVDSRKSVKCPNGWFICDECDSCCSNEKLTKRLESLIKNSSYQPNNPRHLKLKYQVDNQLGHFDQGEKYCHKTGKKM